jgi:hypothetical protein
MDDPITAAPAGFTPEQWVTFQRDGLLHLDGVLTAEQSDTFLGAALETLAGTEHAAGHTAKAENAVARHPAFRALIDLPSHVGYAYDIYGDQLRLSQNDVFLRPPGSVVNHWHIDGPRAVPYRVFSGVLPLKLRIGYWLTDLPNDGMANLVYLPGSHRPDYAREHTGTGDLPGQRVLTCRKGSMTIFSANIWHRIQPNDSETTRVNVFLSYTPSWINGYYFQDADTIPGLTREQRIILRPYGKAQEDFIRPPESDQPLYLDGSAVQASGPVERHKVRRLTRYEQHLRAYDL